MNIQDIAARLIELCRNGEFEKAQKELYAIDAISIEPAPAPGFDKETKGLDAIIEKGHRFQSMIGEAHGNTISEPLITLYSIAFILTMDVTMHGKRSTMSELCVYNIKDGKIVKEEFFI